METREYFEKVMQDFNQNRKGRSLRKYCSDEGGAITKGCRSTRGLLVSNAVQSKMFIYDNDN